MGVNRKWSLMHDIRIWTQILNWWIKLILNFHYCHQNYIHGIDHKYPIRFLDRVEEEEEEVEEKEDKTSCVKYLLDSTPTIGKDDQQIFWRNLKICCTNIPLGSLIKLKKKREQLKRRKTKPVVWNMDSTPIICKGKNRQICGRNLMTIWWRHS